MAIYVCLWGVKLVVISSRGEVVGEVDLEGEARVVWAY